MYVCVCMCVCVCVCVCVCAAVACVGADARVALAPATWTAVRAYAADRKRYASQWPLRRQWRGGVRGVHPPPHQGLCLYA
jgi:hypothetical protein